MNDFKCARKQLVILLLAVSLTGCSQGAESPSESVGPGWISLFDGKSLNGWGISNFGGEGRVEVRRDAIVMDFGETLTGITWKGEFPEIGYEASLEAMRVNGGDFFCGLTFPVADSYCSLIVGGWGGTVVGLSSIDGMDASGNETTRIRKFETGRWYTIRVQVDQEMIRAWIDEEEFVALKYVGRELSVRPEVRLSRPFGIAAWQTRSALRNIRYRLLRVTE